MAAPALAFAVLAESGATAPLERLRDACAEAIARALQATTASGEHLTLVLPHRLTTLLTHVFPRGLAALSQVAECVELTDALTKVRCRSVVYLTLPQIEDVRAVATHAALLRSLVASEANRLAHTFAVLVAGKWTALCAEALAHQRLGDAFSVREVAFGFVPLDRDLLTLGRERCLHDCYSLGNKSVLVDTAAALRQLEQHFGQFEHIKYKGELSAFVCHHLLALEGIDQDKGAMLEVSAGEERGTHQRKAKKRRRHRTMDTLILLDRRVDFASALTTPLTLEALVDELFESEDGFATVPFAVGDNSGGTKTERVVALNASDAVFDRVRGLNIHAVAPALHAQASRIKTAFDRFRSTSMTASTADVHAFVKSVPQMKADQEAVAQLVSLVEMVEATTDSRRFREQWMLERAMMDADAASESIVDKLEELIFRHESLLQVLRLLCLHSVTHGGVPRHDLLRLKRQLVRAYGHELVYSFSTLERLGLLIEQSLDGGSRGIPPFFAAAELLQLIDVDVDTQNPRSAAFVTSGYAPLTCRLVEEILVRGSWQALDGAMNLLDGPRAEIRRLDAKQTKKEKKEKKEKFAATAQAKTETESVSKSNGKRVVVVCLVGGVSYMELAALRWLAKFYPSHELLIASTSVVNGHTMLRDALVRLPSTT